MNFVREFEKVKPAQSETEASYQMPPCRQPHLSWFDYAGSLRRLALCVVVLNLRGCVTRYLGRNVTVLTGAIIANSPDRIENEVTLEPLLSLHGLVTESVAQY